MNYQQQHAKFSTQGISDMLATYDTAYLRTDMILHYQAKHVSAIVSQQNSY